MPSFSLCIKFLNSALAPSWCETASFDDQAWLASNPSSSSRTWAGILVNSSRAQPVRQVGKIIRACSSSHKFASSTHAKRFLQSAEFWQLLDGNQSGRIVPNQNTPLQPLPSTVVVRHLSLVVVDFPSSTLIDS